MGQGKSSDRKILLGHIIGPHGVKGWVKVFSHTEPMESILDYRPWLLGNQEQKVALLEGGRLGKTVIARLEGIGDRDRAVALKGQEIRVDRVQLPELGGAQFYWADLIGLDVVLEDGQALGTIGHMMATGANDVMVVEGDRQRLIPFIRGETVLRVDLESSAVTVRWDPDF